MTLDASIIVARLRRFKDKAKKQRGAICTRRLPPACCAASYDLLKIRLLQSQCRTELTAKSDSWTQMSLSGVPRHKDGYVSGARLTRLCEQREVGLESGAHHSQELQTRVEAVLDKVARSRVTHNDVTQRRRNVNNTRRRDGEIRQP